MWNISKEEKGNRGEKQTNRGVTSDGKIGLL